MPVLLCFALAFVSIDFPYQTFTLFAVFCFCFVRLGSTVPATYLPLEISSKIALKSSNRREQAIMISFCGFHFALVLKNTIFEILLRSKFMIQSCFQCMFSRDQHYIIEHLSTLFQENPLKALTSSGLCPKR